MSILLQKIILCKNDELYNAKYLHSDLDEDYN